MTPEHAEKLTQWRERGGQAFGPPPLPPCPYCHAYDYGCPLGGCRAPRTKYTPEQREAAAEDVYETALVALADLPDETVIDVRDLMPFPERVPLDLETRETMGEFRRRIRELRGGQ